MEHIHSTGILESELIEWRMQSEREKQLLVLMKDIGDIIQTLLLLFIALMSMHVLEDMNLIINFLSSEKQDIMDTYEHNEQYMKMLNISLFQILGVLNDQIAQ